MNDEGFELFRRNIRWVEKIITMYLSPVGTTGALKCNIIKV